MSSNSDLSIYALKTKVNQTWISDPAVYLSGELNFAMLNLVEFRQLWPHNIYLKNYQYYFEELCFQWPKKDLKNEMFFAIVYKYLLSNKYIKLMVKVINK